MIETHSKEEREKRNAREKREEKKREREKKTLPIYIARVYFFFARESSHVEDDDDDDENDDFVEEFDAFDLFCASSKSPSPVLVLEEETTTRIVVANDIRFGCRFCVAAKVVVVVSER